MPGKVNPRQCLCYSFISLFSLTIIVILHKAGSYQQTNSLSSSELHGTLLIPSKIMQSDTRTTPNPMGKSVAGHVQNKNISFPHGAAVRSDVLSAPWVPVLRKILHKFPTKQLNIVVGNREFQSIVLNWLIAAMVKCDKPLENVLVLALDRSLHIILEQREIPSVYVDNSTVVHPDAEMQTRHSHIWITRTTVYRLISSWGYNIALYDSDAIVLKNPQSLFDSYKDRDIIGSAGSYPFLLGEKWGVTFCMGVALFRHTKKTELLWEALLKARNFSLDDQVKLNYALDDCDIEWSGSADTIQVEAVQGECTHHKLRGLRVAILSHRSICRKSPCIPPYYILHRNSRKDSTAKVKVAKAHRVWFLRDDWMRIDNGSGLTGTKWLEAISIPVTPKQYHSSLFVS